MSKICTVFLALISLSFILAGCASSDNTTINLSKKTSTSPPKKAVAVNDPSSVQLITKPVHYSHYSKIGNINVPHYNGVGIKRQQAVINDILLDHAAKIGGNAVIVKKTTLADVGEVIRLPS